METWKKFDELTDPIKIILSPVSSILVYRFLVGDAAITIVSWHGKAEESFL